MRIYGLKNCDNCRKAMKAFPHAELVDVRVQGVPPEVLDRALEQFGAALLNTRSTTWRGLDAVEREREPKDLLVDHPAVMKREKRFFCLGTRVYRMKLIQCFRSGCPTLTENPLSPVESLGGSPARPRRFYWRDFRARSKDKGPAPLITMTTSRKTQSAR